MSMSNYRFLGRLQGLLDEVGFRMSQLSPEEYFALDKNQMSTYVSHGLVQHHCETTLEKLNRLSARINLIPTEDDIRDYKIGLRERINTIRRGDNLDQLPYPINLYDQSKMHL